MSAGSERLKDEGTRSQVVIAGGVAGLVSRFCIAPLDVVKIRLQLQIHSLSDPLSRYGITGPTYKGTLQTMRSIVLEEGVTGLWKGNISAELLYVCYGAIQFTAYRTTTQALQKLYPSSSSSSSSLRYSPKRGLPPAVESFIAGALAGGIATASTYPLDLLRTRFAAQGKQRIYSSIRSSILEIAHTEGPQGFFRGCSAAIIQIVPYMGLFFATYETLRIPLSSASFLPFGSSDAVAGMTASVLAKTGVFPLDLVRKRLQVQGPTRARYVHKNIPEYRGVARTIATIVRTQGVRALYRGLTVSLMKAAPASAVTMWTYERTLKVMKEIDQRRVEQ